MTSAVYFIEGPIGIKIGFSSHLRARFHSLRLKYGDELRILGVIEGGIEVESELHKRFAKHRVYKKEWFAKHPDIYAYIQSHASPNYTPYLRRKYAAINIPYSTYRLLLVLNQATGNSIQNIINDAVLERYPGIDILTREYWDAIRRIDPGNRKTASTENDP